MCSVHTQFTLAKRVLSFIDLHFLTSCHCYRYFFIHFFLYLKPFLPFYTLSFCKCDMITRFSHSHAQSTHATNCLIAKHLSFYPFIFTFLFFLSAASHTISRWHVDFFVVPLCSDTCFDFNHVILASTTYRLI